MHLAFTPKLAAQLFRYPQTATVQPSPASLAGAQHMELAGISTSRHLRARSVSISRPTVCSTKGTGVARRRFCDNRKEGCGARIGRPETWPRLAVSTSLGSSVWRTPVPRPAYETLGRAGGCGRHQGLLEANCWQFEQFYGLDRRSHCTFRLQCAATRCRDIHAQDS
jgi:hypothetical protein